ncbi:hypothetical protein ABZS79_35245 [Streptomyces griseoloalbus]|uniref:hypothetical protein n=1 Tax=Streptomyces griseoloalbus TaxID=67303 RepID=UPI0033B39332
MRRTAIIGALAALAIPFSASAASATTASPDAAEAFRYSFSCSSPEGAEANYSFADGITSTTLYYNNHCSAAFKVTLHFGAFEDCFSTPRGKSSAVFREGLISISKGC